MASQIHDVIDRYGLRWRKMDDLSIELSMITAGGYREHKGIKYGLGLFEHFMRARELAWPERYRHRWTDLIYHEILNNIVTILMGCASRNKTSTASEFVLLDYWAHPHDTIVLVSSTTLEKLDLAVFGELTMLHKNAQTRWPWLAGNRLQSRKAITTDQLEVDNVRDIRKGIIARPCFVGHDYVGIGAFAGIKQKRIRFLADELALMMSTFFDCLPNMFQSADIDEHGEPMVKVIGSGNPKNDPFDMLSISAEPKEGWERYKNVEKTTCWDTKFHKGRCVNLIGTDSPNFDPPVSLVPRYPRLISPNSVRLVEERWGRDSLKDINQCVGRMVMGMIGNRVITKQLCEDHHAFDRAIWRDDQFTNIGFLDPAWGGPNADRCIWGWLKFGTDLNGVQLMELMDIEEVPIVAGGKEPDDQIAEYCKRSAIGNNVPPENIFYDSTGRGTIGAAFARVFGSVVPVPVAFGDRPSDRPVRHDLFVQEENGKRRLKRCDEEYGKRVTELWFGVRNIIECDQFRGLTEALCKEGSSREYQLLPGGKIDVEPKSDMRERTGQSPDLFDGLCCGVFGARERGFKTQRLGYEIIEAEEDTEDFFEKEAKEWEAMIADKLLKH